ncbi:MAG: TonB-dependent receptor [Bacteroidales bacterium]|nr:TonB-dependent receptor [Bacteroidales bacterium]
MKQLTTLILLLIAFRVAAQVEVRGTVEDGDGEPIIGAMVALKTDTKVATVTDIDGNFLLKVPSLKSQLTVTYVGMKPKTVSLNGKNTITIVMEDDAETLSEVVVVGYGQQKKASVVGAITQTDGKALQRTGGVSSLGAALTGNLPGVTTMSSSGRPGDEDPEIVIRGVSSWNNSEPLILVDGIERPMSSVDINSVQSISVLKDASATAVYGVKGANGVILITTKRGQEGRAQIEFNMNTVLKVASKLPKTLDSYDALTVRNMAIENELGLSPDSWSKMTPEAILQKYRNPSSLEEKERYPNVDWEDELFKRSCMSYNPSVNISGGTKVVKYFASIDYLHEGDLFRIVDNGRGYKGGYGYDRLNVRTNFDFQITPTTLFKANLSGSSGKRKSPWGKTDAGSEWFETQLWQAAYSAPSDAFWPVYSDGTWGYYPQDENGAPNSLKNIAFAGRETKTTTRINTDFTLEQKLDFLLKGLRVSATISWDNQFVEYRRGISDDGNDPQRKWINPDTGEVFYEKTNDATTGFDFQESIKWSTNGGSMDNSLTLRNLYYQGQIYWGNSFGKHDVTAMGVFNRTENSVGSEFTHYREDWAFRTTYAFASRYFFEYNGAYNGSEKFSKKNRFAFFNSGAIGWMISEEPFWSRIQQWVPLLKLRYSYGEVGDDNVGDRWLYATQWAYGGSTQQGLDPDVYSPYYWYRESLVGNEDVHWEKAIKQNFGIDYAFFSGLLAGSLDFFHEKRKDILVSGSSRSVPEYYGTTAPTANLGRVRSTGFELELRVNKTFGNGMHLWANFNMTHAENKILSFDDPELLPDYQKTTGYAIGQNKSYMNSGWASTWDQVIGTTQWNTNDDQKLPGMYDVLDYNADGVIDSNDLAPYGYTGTPQNNYNATIGLDWKGWNIMLQFYGVTGVSRYVAFTSLSGNLDTVYDEGTYWTHLTGTGDAPIPRWNSTPNGDYFHSTQYLYDGSYIRLKNAEIGYTWNGGWIKHLGLSMLKLYLNGNNLWLWSKMPDDRESNFAGTGLASQGAYPTMRRFNFGIRFSL